MAVQPAVTPGSEGSDSSQLVRSESILSNRWTILFFSVVSMVAVANFQYGWTLFVQPLQRHLNATTAAVSVTFTVFVLLETWLVPFEGWLVDKFGPRLLVMAGGVLAGLGWVGSGKAETLTALYLSYAVAGIGAGIVYGTAVGSALKWFPEHRGLAAGLTAAGFGAGSAATVIPLTRMIAGSGYQRTFIVWGIIQGLVVVVSAMFLKAPPGNWMPKTWRSMGSEQVRTRQTAVSFSSTQMAATPHFWLMYFMMAMVATGGLMATAQLAPMAAAFGVNNVNFNVWLFGTMATVTFALWLDRIVNGLCRPFWGWVSDHIGREKTMTLAFGLEAIAIFALITLAHNPVMFILLSAFTFFGWAEIFSLFPALCGDFFGRQHATENYGFLYTAKGTSSMFVPVGAALAATTVAGRTFDFRGDILLLLGGAFVLFTLFLAPTVFRIKLNAAVRSVLLTVALVLVTYGIIVVLLPGRIKTPFSASFIMPQIGWRGVFSVAIAFDLIAAVLAFFVLRNMKAPALPAAAEAKPGAKVAA
ncbi:MAG TPA: oxalate/formate MFS antiporter [Candidatus Angelobacter sp.]|nr:oxalate/formate MFS antiporter [Candidatus Angelobacter sp.]